MTEPGPSRVTLTQRQFGPERTDRPAVEIKAKAAKADLDRLVDAAKRIGATDALVAPVSVLAVSEVMRLKCQIPACWGYNASPFCPPRTATAEEMKSHHRGVQLGAAVGRPSARDRNRLRCRAVRAFQPGEGGRGQNGGRSTVRRPARHHGISGRPVHVVRHVQRRMDSRLQEGRGGPVLPVDPEDRAHLPALLPRQAGGPSCWARHVPDGEKRGLGGSISIRPCR